MTQHFNIATGTSVNPFEGVHFVRIADGATDTTLKSMLNKSRNAGVVRLNDGWALNYSLDCLDFVTIITWFEPFRGKFLISTQYGYKSIHFRIDGDTIVCW